MSLERLNNEEIKNMSLIKLAKVVLSVEKRPMKFSETFEKVCELKGLSKDQKQDKISQFYTDLNVDGNFVVIGSNTWGLKRWYGNKTENEVAATTSTSRKKKSQLSVTDEDDLDLNEFDLLDGTIDDVDQDELDDEFADEEMDYSFDPDGIEPEQ